jgi:hypothetical protein
MHDCFESSAAPLLTVFLQSQDSGSPISLVDLPNGFVAGSDRDLLIEALLSIRSRKLSGIRVAPTAASTI